MKEKVKISGKLIKVVIYLMITFYFLFWFYWVYEEWKYINNLKNIELKTNVDALYNLQNQIIIWNYSNTNELLKYLSKSYDIEDFREKLECIYSVKKEDNIIIATIVEWGYYLQWNFNEEFKKQYFNEMEEYLSKCLIK